MINEIARVNIHGGNLRNEAKRMNIKTSKLLDASSSLVPFPPPKSLSRCLSKAVSEEKIRIYPDLTHQNLKQAIGSWHEIDPAMILPGNGAAELITWAARDATEAGLSNLPSPCFSDYERALICWDGSFTHTPIPLSWDTKKPQTFPLKPTGNVIWITNPHNPTGQLWSRKSLENLLEKNYLVICDEAFLALVPNGEKESLIPLVNKYENLIVLRSLTKLFALAGLRLGYAISHQKRLDKWHSIRDPWPLNGIAIAAGIKLMSNKKNLKKWMKKVHKWVKKEGGWLHREIEAIEGLTPLPSSANFLLIKSDTSLTPLRENLLAQRIMLRDCRSFLNLSDKYLRISLQKKSNNRKIINAMINFYN